VGGRIDGRPQEAAVTRIAIELDDATLSEIERIARAKHTSVEAVARETLAGLARQTAPAVPGASHTKMMETLSRPRPGETWRELTHDRELTRAETYAENRARLLELIDTTQGDMGSQGWNRRRLYER
jgi:hypothetical protein